MRTVKVKLKLQSVEQAEKKNNPKPLLPVGAPRISKLVALAIKMEAMLQSGQVENLMQLARLCHVTQPRVSQILNLTLLAPDIQQELLFLPEVDQGKSSIHEKMLRPICAQRDWKVQRKMWGRVREVSINE